MSRITRTLRALFLSVIMLISSASSFNTLAINPVPGEKIDHKGLVINPTPQDLILTGGTVDLSKGFNPFGEVLEEMIILVPELKCDKDGVRIEAVVENNGIANNNRNSSTNTSPVNNNHNHDITEKSGAYTLIIDNDGVRINAFDQRGLFYALQTLRQITSEGIDLSQIPAMTIKDYPILNDRGVVEGFYGNPWSHQVRLSLIDFFGRNKMNVYIYGPKDDPYHNCPDWRIPYPEKEAAQIKELVDACGRNFVDFVWAIHPGQDYKWNEDDYNLLISKFESMYDLGVRRFALFFDDINGDGTNPHNQTKLLNRITEEFVKTHPGVYPLAICPTDYSMIWANPTENGALAIYGRELDPEISVMWTGEVVCGDLTPWAIQFINSKTKRPAYLWWNFPVQDYCREKILQGPVYGLYRNVTPANLTAFVSNPMEHGEASKLALYSVADYTWNPLDYNPLDSWERALVEITPEASEAYRRFAIHSCDTESGYRRDESWETQTFPLNQWDDTLADELQKEFEQIENTPKQLREQAQNAHLISELNPWLDEFAALGTRGRKVIDLARQYRALPEQLDSKEATRFWNDYIALSMTQDQKDSYAKHKVGTLKLQPFYEQMMEEIGKGFYQRLSNSGDQNDPNDGEGMNNLSKVSSPSLPLLKVVEGSASELPTEVADKLAFLDMLDADPSTRYILNKEVTFDITPGLNKIQILSRQNPAFSVIEVDSNGKVLKKSKVKTPLAVIDLQKGTTSIILKGKGEIFNIIE